MIPILLVPGTQPAECQTEGLDTWQDERFFAAWKGLLYRPGAKAGHETVAQLARDLAHTPLPELCRTLHGVFGLLLYDKQQHSWYAITDNAGLYHLFHHGNVLTFSFLRLLDFMKISSDALSPSSIAEFLAHGGVYWTRTLANDVFTIGHDEIVELRPGASPTDGTKTIVRKNLPAHGPSSETSLVESFGALAEALRGHTVSVDLTGGIDSRLTACLLSRHDMDFEVAVSGRPSTPDVIIAERIARILGRPFHPTYHDSSFIEHDIETLFDECDGLHDLLSYHRVGQLQAARRARGVDVAISSAGGELYKDFWWLQDFPRYRSRHVNLERLYDVRIAPIRVPYRYLGSEVADSYRDLRHNTLQRLSSLCTGINTESYDNIYYFYKMSTFAGRFLTTNINHHVDFAAPFLDYDNFLVGFGLPRTRRFFDRFHRSILTRECRELARLTTTENVSASAEPGRMLVDGLGYAINKGRRLATKAAERLTGRTRFRGPGPDDPEMLRRVRNGAAFRQAVRALSDLGVLRGDLEPDTIRDAHVGRVLTLGILAQRLR